VAGSAGDDPTTAMEGGGRFARRLPGLLPALIVLALAIGLFWVFAPPIGYLTRTSLASCGSERAGAAGPWNVEGRQCLWDAYQAGRPAEFVSTRSSVEGDPVTTTLRLLGSGRVEIYIDGTRDRWGQGWTRLECPTLGLSDAPQPAPDFTWGPGCQERPV